MKYLLRFLKRLPFSRIIVDFLLFIITFFVLQFFGGLISNSAYAGAIPPWVRPVWDNLKLSIFTHLINILSIVSGISIILLCFLFYLFKDTNKALALTDKLAKLDDSLLRLLAKSISARNGKTKIEIQGERKRLLFELLRDATETVLGNKNYGRAAILSPDLLNSNGDYLQINAYHRMDPQTVARTRFYIGDDETRSSERGTVGVVYREKHLCVGHLELKNGRWVADNDDYRVFDQHRARPQYDTFINIPILVGSSKNGQVSCLGVLCLDSQIPNAFDSRRSQETLVAISRRFAATLLIYETL